MAANYSSDSDWSRNCPKELNSGEMQTANSSHAVATGALQRNKSRSEVWSEDFRKEPPSLDAQQAQAEVWDPDPIRSEACMMCNDSWKMCGVHLQKRTQYF